MSDESAGRGIRKEIAYDNLSIDQARKLLEKASGAQVADTKSETNDPNKPGWVVQIVMRETL